MKYSPKKIYFHHGFKGGGGVFKVTPRPIYPPQRNLGLIVQEGRWPLGPDWTGAEILTFTGIRSPDRPNNYILHIQIHIGADITSWAGIATCYGLDGPKIESRWGQGFPHPPIPALRSTQPPIQWVPCLSRT